MYPAGAGNTWSYKTRQGEVTRRSEGLAVASLEMFLDGLFSDDKNVPHQVTGECHLKLAFILNSQYLLLSLTYRTVNIISGDVGKLISQLPACAT